MAEWKTCDIEKAIFKGIRMLEKAGNHPEKVYMSPDTRCQLIIESPQITCALEKGEIVEYIFGLKVETREDFESNKIYVE